MKTESIRGFIDDSLQDTTSVQDQNDKLKVKVKELTKALDLMLNKAESKASPQATNVHFKQLQDSNMKLQIENGQLIHNLQNQLVQGGQEVNGNTRVAGLQGIIRTMKSKEKKQANQINQLKKEIESKNTTMQMSSELESLYAFKSEYQQLERLNQTLKSEIMALKRIKNMQGKDLKSAQDNDWTVKFKYLSDEVKFYKEKKVNLQDDLKREQKNSQIHLLKISQLKEQLHKQIHKQIDKQIHIVEDNHQEMYNQYNYYQQNGSPNSPRTQANLIQENHYGGHHQHSNEEVTQNPQKMTHSELERQNAILKRAKDSIQQKQINQKVKSEKKIDRLQKQNTLYEIKIAEQEKEIKIHQVKLREFMQKNIDKLPAQTFKQIETIMNPVQIENKNKNQTRKMADTYKKIRMQNLKNDQSVDEQEYMDDYEQRLTQIKKEQERYKEVIANRSRSVNPQGSLPLSNRAIGNNIGHLQPKSNGAKQARNMKSALTAVKQFASRSNSISNNEDQKHSRNKSLQHNQSADIKYQSNIGVESKQIQGYQSLDQQNDQMLESEEFINIDLDLTPKK